LEIPIDPKSPIDILCAFTVAFDLLNRAEYLMIDSAWAAEMAQRWNHMLRAVRFYERPESVTDSLKCRAVDILSRLPRRKAAQVILKKTGRIGNQTQILGRLSLWSGARQGYDSDLDEGPIAGY
jgi:hypothetical protein